MNNILEVINNKKKIMARQDIFCPACGEKQFSPFDKLFTESYGKCFMCEPDKDQIKSDNIFAIIEEE